MKLSLSENIRGYRKQRKLTQEKLAEALGVTVGAVYKWESGLSLPELSMIVEIADFFDISVDALLGYKMKDNRLDALEKHMTDLLRTMDPTAVTEAEKALAKYPHIFRIVYLAASTYLAFGAGNHDKAQLMRALELLEHARLLLPQNDDPRISEETICSNMSVAWFQMNEYEKGLELLKQNNTCGIFSSDMGFCLAAFMSRPEEALHYLSEGLLSGLSSLFTTVLGFVFVFCARNDWDSALNIIDWSLHILNGVKTEGKTDYLDKAHAELLVVKAYVQKKAGKPDASFDSLKKAAVIADSFDLRPDYSLNTIRFAENTDQTVVFDAFGASAAAGAAALIRLFNDPELAGQWEEMLNDVS